MFFPSTLPSSLYTDRKKSPGSDPVSLYVGLGGVTRNACVTLCDGREVLGICEQERITRVRGAGFGEAGLPDEALDELLRRSALTRDEVTAFVLAESLGTPEPNVVRLNHHFAHACAAFLPSPFDSATIVVCDDDSPEVSVWDGDRNTITQIEWPWRGAGFARVYSQFARALGFAAGGHETRMEALARLDPTHRDRRTTQLLALEPDQLRLAPDWLAQVESWIGAGELCDRVAVAAALQSRIGDLIVEFLAEVKRRAPARRALCVGGTLFSNSYFNSIVKLHDGFDEAFIPINPGNAGLSVGAALHASGQVRATITPFLGPSYSAEEIKATLDNCKLTYRWAGETERLETAVLALLEGRLVGLFDGPMEWGPRALGARSIVASPFAPYVLNNLNEFLKRREMWRGYALSGLESAVHEHFEGPDSSPYMECDYAPKDRTTFRHVLPGPKACVRIQTVRPNSQPRFAALLRAFGDASGIPILVNTSFNGIREPIVCSPNDAVRVFFSSGVDVLIAGDFIVRK
jgi:carbamoyltransferase